MVKAGLKNLLVSIFLVFFVSCTITSSYSRQDIDKAIKKICKEEFDLDVGVWVKKDTVWVYAPFEKLIDSQGQYDEKADKDLQHIYLSLLRTFLNMDDPPKFCCFIASNIKEFGLDTYSLVFIPNMIKHNLGFISRDEFNKKNVYLNFSNIQALSDEQGEHIKKYDISVVEFLALLIQQSIEREFLYSQVQDNYQFNSVSVEPYTFAMDVSFDIIREDHAKNLPLPLERIEKLIKEILIYYSSFHQIQSISLNDKFRQKTKELVIPVTRKNDYTLKPYNNTINQSLINICRVNTHINNAAKQYEKGGFEPVIDEYKKALKIIPDDTNALYGLGNAYYVFGQYKEALKYLDKAQELKPGYYEIEIPRVLSYINLGQTSKALSVLEDVIAANPENAVVHNNAGYVFLTLGNYERALKHYQKVLQIDKDFPEINKYLGYTHSRLKNYGQAIVFLEKVIKRNPSDFEVYYELGSIYTTLMKYQEATINFQKCLAISDNYAPAYASLGLIYGYLGQIEKPKPTSKRPKSYLKQKAVRKLLQK